MKPTELDDRLRALLDNSEHQFAREPLLALGPPALIRLLDYLEGKATLETGQTEMQWRDHGDWRANGVTLFAEADLGAVLRAVEARGWSALAIARAGIARIPDPKVVPYLLALLASKSPLDRAAAVNALALHRDPRATDALISALKDRSSDVKLAAIEALGTVGDPRAIEPLAAFAERAAERPRSAWLARSAKEAIASIRSKVREAP